jgi:peroxiredoxin/outer membrane lipoprotein-sorting protein
MQKKILVAIILLLLILTLSRQDNARTAQPINDEPSADAIYTKMIESLKSAETLYIESACRSEENGKEWARGGYKLWLKKPSLARIEGIDSNENNSGVLVGDGSDFWIYWPNGRPFYGFEDSTTWSKSNLTDYMHFPLPARHFSIAHHVNYLGIGMPMTIIQPSVFHGGPDLLAETIDSIQTIGSERIDGELCTIIEVSYMNGQRIRKLWISDRTNLPRKLTQSIKVTSLYMNYEDWTKVEVNSSVPDSLFVWKPGDGWTEFRIPELEEGLLAQGEVAPDFRLALTSGGAFSLNEHRGKPVIINFWRIGCPPCRKEVPYLQTIHEKYKDKGLVVLGFNCSDDKKLAMEFLDEFNATYPNIIDTTKAAQDIFFHKYQTLQGISALPLNYLIDFKGQVVQAWYGYGGDTDKTFEEALKKIGLQ